MKYYELTPEEQELHDIAERGELISIPDLEKQKAEMVASAKKANSKTRNVNLRLSERTMFKLKSKAAEEGIPYQTLAASILHKNIQ